MAVPSSVEAYAQGTCFGFQVHSALRFRYLRHGQGPSLRVVPSRQAGLGPEDRFVRSWEPRSPDQVGAQLYARGRTFRLRVGETEWFEVDPFAGIIAAPDSNDILYLEQHVWGIPSALCFLSHGDLALHAAAVEVDGSALLLAAPGGSGKSTLAAAFLRAGHRLLSEDLSCVRPATPPSVVPGPAMLRLRRDVVQDLDVPGQPVRTTRDRITYALLGSARGDCAPVRLAGIVFLFTSAGTVRMEQMPAAQAIPHLWALSLQLPTEAHKKQLFDSIVPLASQVPAWKLDRPLRLQELPAIVELISLTCQGLPAAGRTPSLL